MAIRVLLAEPDEVLLVSYREFLSRDGFEVVTATNGLDCLARLRDCSPDVLVLELRLPWGWGDGVLAIMREQSDVPLVPVLVLGSGDGPLTGDDISFPVKGYYVKPLGPDQLAKSIRSLLDSPEWRITSRLPTNSRSLTVCGQRIA